MSDVVWTALVTGATGISTGALGYLGARQQTRAELIKLEKEREDPNTARNLAFRQALYLRYLDSSDAFRDYPSPSCVTRNGLIDIGAQFRRADDEMELFAAANVLPARQELWSVASKLVDAVEDIADGPDDDAEFEQWFAKKYRAVYIAVETDWLIARRAVVTAIREDVGPSATANGAITT